MGEGGRRGQTDRAGSTLLVHYGKEHKSGEGRGTGRSGNLLYFRSTIPILVERIDRSNLEVAITVMGTVVSVWGNRLGFTMVVGMAPLTLGHG
jgi:hypothetical protein